jgi:hypothetical protein
MGAFGVHGDPAGMRQLAAQCRARADSLMQAVGQAERSVRSMHFDAPAATRLRQQLAEETAASRADAHALMGLADRLVQGAAGVEREVASRRAAQERERRAREKSHGASGGW